MVVRMQYTDRLLDRVLGSSQYTGVKTLVRYTLFTSLAGFIAWQAHPYLLDAIGYVLDLNWKE